MNSAQQNHSPISARYCDTPTIVELLQRGQIISAAPVGARPTHTPA